MPQNFDQIQRQRAIVIWLVGILLAAMCAALVLVTWSGDQPMFQLEQRWPAFGGLCGLVVLFVLYVQYKQRQFAALEARLRDVAIREAAMQARFSELSFLFDTSTQLQLRLDLQSMLDLATQRLIPCLDAHQSSIMLFDETAGTLVVRAASGVEAERVANAQVKPGEGVAGQVFSTNQPLNLTGAAAKERFAGKADYGRNIAAGLCVPMCYRGNPIGVVSVARTSGEPFSDLHARMLSSFAEHCAATVVKTNHHRELLQSVRTAA